MKFYPVQQTELSKTIETAIILPLPGGLREGTRARVIFSKLGVKPCLYNYDIRTICKLDEIFLKYLK